MGKLIDADEVKKQFPIMENDFGMVINERLHKHLDKIPTVEAIPKADYENRLKADMVAMLEDLRLDFQEAELAAVFDNKELIFADEVDDLVQQKINALKENKDE